MSPTDVNTEIYARRITGVTPSATALTATVPTLAGAARSTGAQNVDVESDNAGNAWVAFRESFTYPVANNRNRPLVRRLSGNTFAPPLLLDPGPTPPVGQADAEFTRLAVTPSGDRAVASGFIQVGRRTSRARSGPPSRRVRRARLRSTPRPSRRPAPPARSSPTAPR